MILTEPQTQDTLDHSSTALLRALLSAPARPGALLEAAIGPLCMAAGATFGALLALEDGASAAAAIWDGVESAEADRALLDPLLMQGIAGYAVARGAPVVVNDLAVDPRWGPPSLDPALPDEGAALALPIGDPACAVLVLVSPAAAAFTAGRVRRLAQEAGWLREPLTGALALSAAHAALGRLDARDALRRDLSAMAMHDMRTPLQNIQLAFKAIERQASHSMDTDFAARARELIGLGQHSAEHLATLSKTLLDIARLEDDQVALRREPAALEPLISGALQTTGALLENTGCSWAVEVAPGLGALPLDSALIERVLVNLIDNAVKHSPPGGLIEIRAAPLAGGAVVRVADHGPGIPPSLQEDVFDKYFQIQPQDGSRPGGVGLGLAFCRTAVMAHGGEIWAENAPEGGAVFSFTLPG